MKSFKTIKSFIGCWNLRNLKMFSNKKSTWYKSFSQKGFVFNIEDSVFFVMVEYLLTEAMIYRNNFEKLWSLHHLWWNFCRHVITLNVSSTDSLQTRSNNISSLQEISVHCSWNTQNLFEFSSIETLKTTFWKSVKKFTKYISNGRKLEISLIGKI